VQRPVSQHLSQGETSNTLARSGYQNFRKLEHAEFSFQSVPNVLARGNNVGKTAVVKASCALLAGRDEPHPRLGKEDIHRPEGGPPSGDLAVQVRRVQCAG
jgi:putative ATP-dependent endonuclease of OLD family